jgi:hypothetical protein
MDHIQLWVVCSRSKHLGFLFTSDLAESFDADFPVDGLACSGVPDRGAKGMVAIYEVTR